MSNEQSEIEHYEFGSALWAGQNDPVLVKGTNDEVFWNSFLGARGGKGFSRIDCDENRTILLQKYEARCVGQPIVRSQLSQLWYMLMISHCPDFVDPQGEEPAERVVSPEQEYREWMEGKSELQIRERRASDRAFAAFYTASNRAQVLTDDPMANQNYHNNIRTEKANVSQGLRDFAAEYQRTPVAEVKRRLSPATNPAGHLEFSRNFEAALSAGLL